ncbi:conserved hypothetical protein [Culex quinquefasciatus]|uniref:Farnesoic acid O-methyl transferase domain-containing protein n=1 Tax=Culex quinquefasciatus TaxID=7176 RepID=B0X400_CULQU|nr:conserved hypothetical protein [Culex quinquefasciatus]|eukprot:XP_001864372.1 conserved hypothetical protein [Culex quinquefasciatus]
MQLYCMEVASPVKMIFATAVLAIVVALSGHTESAYENTFDATKGCLQYNSHYYTDYAHPYFSTDAFRNVRRGPDNSTEFRFGMLGEYNAIFRLSPVQYPYDNTQMCELELFCWQTNICEVRRYVRKSPSEFTKYKQLQVKSGRGSMSRLEPFMFTLAIYPDGSATLTKDGATEPFLEFQDTTISFRYIGFSDWSIPVIYFFDCPHKQ